MDILRWADKYSIDCRLKYNSSATQNNYISQVKSFLARFKDEAEPKSIQTIKIKEWLLEANTINTRKHRLCAVKSFYELTLKMPDKIGAIPYPRSEKKLPIVLSQEEVQRMFDACKNLKHKAILCLLYSAGLRVSELINLKWSHIDRSRMIINIIGAKGSKDRQAMLSQSIVPVLEEYYRMYKSKEYVFNGQNNEPKYTIRSVGEVMKQLSLKAGIHKRVYTHLMRHNCFTHMVESGIDINLIQRLAGHTNVKTTSMYCHISHNIISKINSPISNIRL